MAEDVYKDPFAGLPRRGMFREVTVAPKPKAAVVAEPKAEPASNKAKRGRPSLNAPWFAAGVSRRTWFRRRKAEK